MRIYTIISRLLDYPTVELMENLPVVMEILNEDDTISEHECNEIKQFISWMHLGDLIHLQQDYVNTFDMVPEHDLHLTHHLFGDDRGRGPALIDLSEHYKANGLEVDAKELPDYLPLILEYLSTLDEMQARIFLADAKKTLTVIADNLAKTESPYARLVRIVENRGQLAIAA